MNKKLGLAVAGALLAASASAQAGITIPAGDWTLDIGGVVNAYYTSTRVSGDAANSTGTKTANNITTGLLPNYLAVSGKSRQNDLDIGFTISINPGASTNGSANQAAQQENRQAFLTIGDASWGSVKLGKDLGIYASDAILNDMTLLGVGSAAGSLAGNTTTLGRIGTGFMYADWKSQVAYTSPNWNGFQFTAGVTQSWDPEAVGTVGTGTYARGGSQSAYEAKASYAWTGDVAGKVWASGFSQNVELHGKRANAWDLGANVNVAGLGLTGYYGEGKGTGTAVLFNGGFTAEGARRESKDWYVQATYALPTATKLGVSYGESKLDYNKSEGATRDYKNEMWTVGAYHPITKSVNLVAEYSDVKNRNYNFDEEVATNGKARTVSLGAILFF